ncbi:MAG: hypothetical protein HQL19_00830 [Candidatus Omnitrophica bacterium]|nr:hypothetical protein [Candidatus Omnitrophota bacterium]
MSLGIGAGVLPEPGSMVGLSQAVNPPMLKGVKVYVNDPFRFDFILDKGSQLDVRTPLAARGHVASEEDALQGYASSSADGLRVESEKLIKYFLASLTVPEKDLWVNLSPYEKDRIIPNEFGQTEMGRDLLAQDYILKQVTASLLYPEGETGKKFWAEIYKQAAEKYGTTDIPVDTFNKVWILPQKAVVYEKSSVAYITESRLKVMLESDYVAAQKHGSMSKDLEFDESSTTDITSGVGAVSKAILREIVIPVLEKEINEGANFSKLRQIYNALILAAWYKKKINKSLLSKVYIDQKKINGVNIDDLKMAEKIWAEYVEAFKKGAVDLIREEKDALSGDVIPRKYFSGGIVLKVPVESAQTVSAEELQNDHSMVIHSRVKNSESAMITTLGMPTEFILGAEKFSTETFHRGLSGFEDAVVARLRNYLRFQDVENTSVLVDEESFFSSDTADSPLKVEAAIRAGKIEGVVFLKNGVGRIIGFAAYQRQELFSRNNYFLEKNTCKLTAWLIERKSPLLRNAFLSAVVQSYLEHHVLKDSNTALVVHPLLSAEDYVQAGFSRAAAYGAAVTEEISTSEGHIFYRTIEESRRAADEVKAYFEGVAGEQTEHAMIVLSPKDRAKAMQELHAFANENRRKRVPYTLVDLEKKYGIYRRTIAAVFQLYHVEPLGRLSKNALKLYEWARINLGAELDRTQPEIAEEYKVPQYTVQEIFSLFGIKTKGRRGAVSEKTQAFIDWLGIQNKDLLDVRNGLKVLPLTREALTSKFHISEETASAVLSARGFTTRGPVGRAISPKGQAVRDWADNVRKLAVERAIQENAPAIGPRDYVSIPETREQIATMLGVSSSAVSNICIEKKITPRRSGTKTNDGGIDLNTDRLELNVQSDGQGIEFHIDPAQIAALQNASGFIPVIMNIQPLDSLSEFLGITQ